MLITAQVLELVMVPIEITVIHNKATSLEVRVTQAPQLVILIAMEKTLVEKLGDH